jgi:predicted Fe-Mo cluster-binding NifX family protein
LIVAVSAASGSLDAQIDPRFGRCQYFVIVDTESMSFEVLSNMSRNTPHGAGIQAGQTVANHGVQAVLTGNVGPNAFQVLSSAGIRVITGLSGTVREAIEKLETGQLKDTAAPTSPSHFGAGGGVRGMRRGGGRGMGQRRW